MASEMRLIDPKKAIYLAEHSGFYDFDLSDLETLLFDESCITVDAVEVVHGRWVYEDVDFVCSECGSDAMLPWNKPFQIRTNYCPNCGAKMEVEPQCQTK